VKVKVFALHDSAVKTFFPPNGERFTANAIRSFEQACRQEGSQLALYPSNFQLYELGEMDDETGILEAHSPVRLVASATEFARKSVTPQLKEASNA